MPLPEGHRGATASKPSSSPRLFCAVASLPIPRAGGRDPGGNRAMPISARHKFSQPLENASMDSNFT